MGRLGLPRQRQAAVCASHAIRPRLRTQRLWSQGVVGIASLSHTREHLRSHARTLNPLARGYLVSPDANFLLRQRCAPMRYCCSPCISTSSSVANHKGVVMSIVSEFFDRLPNLDGNIRRRFTSGILFLLILGAGVFWVPGIPDLANDIGHGIRAANLDISSLDSFFFGVILLSAIFLLGTVLEVVSEIFIRRTFSTLVRQFVTIPRADDGPFPELVKQGLRNPFSRNFDVAFRYLIHIAPDDEKMWLHGILSRNRNVFSIMSSTFLSVFIVVVLSIASDRSNAMNNLGSADARMCYKELVRSMQRENLIRNEDDRLVSAIGEKKYDAVEYIRRILRERRPKVEMNHETKEHNGVSSSYSALDEKRLECQAFEDPNMITGVSDKTVVISSTSIFLFVIVLAFSYAWIVRDSIENALNVVLLRVAGQEKTAEDGE